MSRIEDRFKLLSRDRRVVIDEVEGVEFQLVHCHSADKLCKQLQSMHYTNGVLLEELERLKFPPTTWEANPAQINAEFDAQELFGEPFFDVMGIKNNNPDTSKMTNEELLDHLLAKLAKLNRLAKLNKSNSENIAALGDRLNNLGESEVSSEIKKAAPDLAFLLDGEFYVHELDKLTKVTDPNG